jgi:hypothetical protein
MSRKEAVAFAEFTRNQGMIYLEAIDDWLEQRRVNRKTTPGRKARGASVAAGVHLFAYMDDYGSLTSNASIVRVGKKVTVPERTART